MNRTINVILSVAAALLTMSCSNESSLFQRENDVVTCDCSEQIISQSIKCDGKWTSDCSGTEWVKISPESGEGDGKYIVHMTCTSATMPVRPGKPQFI